MKLKRYGRFQNNSSFLRLHWEFWEKCKNEWLFWETFGEISWNRMNHFDENIWSLNFLSHKETFFEKGGNFLKLFSVINQRMNFDNTCGNSKNMTFKCLVLNLNKISSIYIFQSIYSSHVRKIYVQVVIGLEHLKSFDLRNMKSSHFDIWYFGCFPRGSPKG